MAWLDYRLRADPELEQLVNERLAEMELERKLAKLRQKAGLTQAELARRMGVSQPMVAKLESGRIKNLELRTLVKAVQALGARVEVRIST